MSALIANPQLLLNLQGLVNAGHINPEEFAAEKAKLFNAPFEAATPGILQNALSSICAATQQISDANGARPAPQWAAVLLPSALIQLSSSLTIGVANPVEPFDRKH